MCAASSLWWRCSLLAGDWEEKIGPAGKGKRKARIKSDQGGIEIMKRPKHQRINNGGARRVGIWLREGGAVRDDSDHHQARLHTSRETRPAGVWICRENGRWLWLGIHRDFQALHV